VFAARVVRNATQSERRRSDSAAATATVGRGKGRRVTLTSDPTQDERDRYGRLLAYVKTDVGVNVGRKLIAQGWATTYVYNNVPFLQVPACNAAEDGARSARRGVYRSCGGNFHRATSG
jgi:micrococcal nuclease